MQDRIWEEWAVWEPAGMSTVAPGQRGSAGSRDSTDSLCFNAL